MWFRGAIATQPPAAATDTPAPPPTETKIPTATKIPASPTPEIQEYFTETFQGDLSHWSYFLRSGDPEKFLIEPVSDGMKFELTGKGIFSYLYYDAFDYDEVRIEAVVENQGVNDNNVTLFCMYSEEGGWYELNVYSSGLYDMYFTKPDSAGNLNYGLIAEGGSNKINMGQAVNKYSLVCKNDGFVVYINDVETRSVGLPSYVLDSGMVGVSVSSFGQVPVKVIVKEFTISKP
jgi:hypothetical protein